MNKNVLPFLKKAKQRIEGGWCQNHCALDKHGDPVIPASKDAVRFCIVGSARATELDFEESERFLLREEAYAYLCLGLPDHWRNQLPRWNDFDIRTKEEVLALFDKAIKMVEDGVELDCAED